MPGADRRALDWIRYESWPYLFFPALMSATAILFGEGLRLGDAPHLLRDTFVTTLCIGGPVHLTFELLYDRLRRLPPRLQLAAGAGIVALGVLAGTELALAVLTPLHARRMPSDLGRQQIWAIAFVGVGFVSAVLFAFARFRERIREAELRELRAESEALGAQIRALQARIQPHFLFNCLNTVASLIEEDPRRAEAALERLSDLFRHALKASERRLVPLREELDSVAGFLELEELRHGARLRVRMHVERGLEDVPVPPLVLQPLVENAVLHGVTHRREGGLVEVRVAREGGRVALQVDDDGPGPSGSPYAGSGTALRDLAERLRLLYAGEAALEHGAGPLGGYRVRVAVPLAPRAQEGAA
jgi:two-component system sensor histidine kinase AlgZ